MLYVIKGRAGTGKTKYMHQLFASLAESNEKLLFIVPDTATFDTRNRFMDEISPENFSNIQIHGFSTLCDMIINKSSYRSSSFAETGLKHLVMDMSIDSCRSKLDVFKARSKSKDLCDVMLSTLTDFKQRQITYDDLFKTSNEIENKRLKSKLYEIATIFKAYDTYISASHIDPVDILSRVKEIIENEGLFEGYTIGIDSHKAFNKQQLDFLSVLIKQSKDIYFSLLTDDEFNQPGELFFINSNTEGKLIDIANREHVDVGVSDFIPVQQRFSCDDLDALECKIFRGNEIEPFVGECNHIEEYEAQSIYDESDFVARNIQKLIIDEKYRYKDIAVIARHPEKYQNILDLAFKKYNISYFISKPQRIDHKPLVKFVTSCFDAVNDYFDKDDILSILKTGLTSFSREEISIFENYVFIWGVNGKRFHKEFINNPRGYVDDNHMLEIDEKNLKIAECVRSTIIGALEEFDDACRNATGKDIAEALLKLLYRLNVDKNIKRLARKFDDYDKENSKDLFRIWNLLMQILDDVVNVTGDYTFSRKRFSELLYTYITNSDISYIPSGIDQVTLYDASKISFNDKKIVFVIGCNDNEFPSKIVEKTLFSDDECDTLVNYDLNVSDRIEDVSSQEILYAYVALTRATEKLYLSYYKQELVGDTVTKSSVLTLIERLFPSLKISCFEDLDVMDHLWSEKAAFDYFAETYLDDNFDSSKLELYFTQKSEYNDVIDSIKTYGREDNKNIKDTTLAKELFGKELSLSASKVDEFYMCKFKYFIDYGLNIKERRRAEVDSLEYGLIIHYILQCFVNKHKNDDFSIITDDMIGSEVNEYINYYAEKHLSGLEDKDEKFIYLFERMKQTAISLIIHMVNELSQSDFIPSDFELKIGEEIDSYELSTEDTVLKVTGSIDRVDLYDDLDIEYIRIIDYKTGNKEFSLSDIYYGINLQMFIYLAAIIKNGREKYGNNILPAGVLYNPAKEVEVSVDSIEKVDDEKNKSLKMKGLVLNNDRVISAMDKELKGKYIPVSFKKDGAINSNCLINVASLEEFSMISNKIDSLLLEMANSLSNGIVEDVPAKGKYNACRWCSYSSVCMHAINGKKRIIRSMKREELYNKLGGELDGQCMDKSTE